MFKVARPKELVTLQLGNGKMISFMSNDIDDAVTCCKWHLNKLGLSSGVLVDGINGIVLEDIVMA